jgi:transcriptional regulator with XRE-family HTH domain
VLTTYLQTGLPALRQSWGMSLDPVTPAERFKWAKERSRKTWHQLGAEVGCTHATLVQWSSGKTDVLNAEVSFVVAYARATGVSLQWLLTGEGERLTQPTRREHQLVAEARHIVAERPALAEGAYRMLLALESIAPSTGPQ